MIEPFDLNQFEETRYLEPPTCTDEIARLRQMVEGLRNEIELDWSPQVDKLSMQVIQLEAQAATAAAESDELRQELADAVSGYEVERKARIQAMQRRDQLRQELDTARQSCKRLVFAVRIERDFAEIGAEFAKTAEQALKICETQRDDAQADARELARVLKRNVSDFKKVNYMLRDSGYHGFDLAVKESEQSLTERGAKYLPQEDGRAYVS